MSHSTDRSDSDAVMLARLNAITDGVAAIALTLLVLGINVPQDHDFSRDGLLSFLGKAEYELTVYAVSFVLIGTFWVVHNLMFRYFQRGTRALTWLNLLFLFLLSLLPFATQLIGTYRHEPLVIIVYGAVSIACSLSLALIWWYANKLGDLILPKGSPDFSRAMMRHILQGAALSLGAIAVAFINVRIAHVVFLATPLLYVSHRNVDSQL